MVSTRRLLDRVVRLELDIDHRVVPELLGRRRQPGQQGHAAQQLGAQPEDEVADVTDRHVEAVDGALDAPDDLVGVLLDQLRDVLEGEAHGVDALDDPVVEVLADPLALVDDGQALDLLVQARVLDRDRRVAGERLDERLVGRGELLPGRLVGEVQVADRAALHRHRDAEEAVHLRMVRREPVASLVEGDVGDPDRAVLADDQAEEAVTARQGADPRPCLAVQAGGDEGLDHPAGVDDPECGVARADQRTDLVDDDLAALPRQSPARRSPGSPTSTASWTSDAGC